MNPRFFDGYSTLKWFKSILSNRQYQVIHFGDPTWSRKKTWEVTIRLRWFRDHVGKKTTSPKMVTFAELPGKDYFLKPSSTLQWSYASQLHN